MTQKKQTTGKYFQDALSDFVYDAASGRAIRHLADTGYTTAQIVRQLHYPTPFEKVQHTVTRHFIEIGILLEELPVPLSGLRITSLKPDAPETLYRFLSECVRQNGEESSYASCPFGIPGAFAQCKRHSLQPILTGRELEYLEGIAWAPKTMYHRLNRRMLEISTQLAAQDPGICFYFLKSREMVKPEY